MACLYASWKCMTNLNRDVYSQSGKASYYQIWRSLHIWLCKCLIVLKFERRIWSSAAGASLKFQNDNIMLIPNLPPHIEPYEISRQGALLLSHYKSRASVHQADGRLIARSLEVSKTWDSGLDFSNSSDIWGSPQQQRGRYACQISERYEQYSIQSRGSETLVVRRLTAHWN